MRFGNLLNEIPLWEVVDGTVLNAHGVAEVGVRLQIGRASCRERV